MFEVYSITFWKPHSTTTTTIVMMMTVLAIRDLSRVRSDIENSKVTRYRNDGQRKYVHGIIAAKVGKHIFPSGRNVFDGYKNSIIRVCIVSRGQYKKDRKKNTPLFHRPVLLAHYRFGKCAALGREITYTTWVRRRKRWPFGGRTAWKNEETSLANASIAITFKSSAEF